MKIMIVLLAAALLILSLAWFRHWLRRGKTMPKAVPGPAPASSAAPVASAGCLLGHEIKNYLCTLRGNALLLRQRAEDEDQLAIIDRIDRVVEKLEVFAAGLRANDTGLKTDVMKKVDLARIASACVRTHFPLGGARFVWDVAEGLPAAWGDAGKLEQVFLNLYSNALEAGATRVETVFALRGESLEVRIVDDGRGCAPESLGRIFEPFFSTKAGARKRGLGLFIVQSILTDHRCRILAESRNRPDGAEHGLVFRLSFPVSKSIAVKISAAPHKVKTARPFPVLKGSFSRAILEP